MAMEAVDQHLVRRDHGLVQLLDPPFDQSRLDPGYIRGYVPGVRENGGQYTHARDLDGDGVRRAGRRERAWELAGDDQSGAITRERRRHRDATRWSRM